VRTAINPQGRHGADVITRIEFEIGQPDGNKKLQQEIAGLIDGFIAELCKGVGVDPVKDVVALSCAGNTTMLHFLAGVPARGIAVAPFTPGFLGPVELKPADVGLASMSPNGAVSLLPCVSAYVGADIVADVYACAMHRTQATELLIDLGTNGEIVLAAGGKLYTCSCAAGPAFEGANISCGCGGVEGAVDTVKYDAAAGDIKTTTIAGKPPIGLCGSGLVDAVAALLETGAVDETGRIIGPDDDEEGVLPKAVGERVFELPDGMTAVRLTEGVELTQKDVRELQNAKAAIAAGVDTLLGAAGIVAGDVDRVWLAGGFGSVINRHSAARVGIYPAELAERVRAAGNAAGVGACCALVSGRALGDMIKARDRMQYIELSGLPGFMDAYVEHMMF